MLGLCDEKKQIILKDLFQSDLFPMLGVRFVKLFFHLEEVLLKPATIIVDIFFPYQK